MQKRLWKVFLLLLFVAGAGLAHGVTAIDCGRLLDVRTGQLLHDQVILVEQDRMIAVGGQALLEQADTIIKLGGDYTVLPGLIDAHVHPLIFGDDYQVNHLKLSSAAKALHGLHAVQGWLREGWTTIQIAGDADVEYAPFDIRDAIDAGLFIGPRILGAGHYLSATGGGGDINFLGPEQQVIADGLIVDGPAQMRKAVRREIKYGSDWIKLLVTGAYMSAGDNPQAVHFSDAELRVAFEEAENRGLPVMVHAHAAAGIKKAVRMGARSIEHGSFLDDEAIELMLAEGTWLVPTLAVGRYLTEQQGYSDAMSKAVALHERYDERNRAMLRKAITRGVRIAVGSDNVGFPPYFAAREFEELTRLGMSPMQAIQAGTRGNAELLMKEHEIGSIEAGKYADIIAVKGNPLDDISKMKELVFVMRSGQVIRSD
ncbi:MAG: amidohydrolase family protein [Wenzhouxiangellaceae bacterium]|nr:amidohydrolase family protein [Wenzhouxiangellaceae bacterium]